LDPSELVLGEIGRYPLIGAGAGTRAQRRDMKRNQVHCHRHSGIKTSFVVKADAEWDTFDPEKPVT
jgi:hypothetical protein